MALPHKIIEVLKTDLEAKLSEVDIAIKREPRKGDPNCSLYFISGVRRPMDKCMGRLEPVRQSFDVLAVLILKYMDEEEGQMKIDDTSSNLWSLIYGDQELEDHLRALEDVSFGMTRRVQKYEITNQNHSPQISVDGKFISSSMTNIRFEITASG